MSYGAVGSRTAAAVCVVVCLYLACVSAQMTLCDGGLPLKECVGEHAFSFVY